jgi:periplasmic protein TonB
MKTKTMVIRHWEDVVFENRNRDYGAYVLRRAYSKRVILGWGITVALFASLLYFSNLALPNPADVIKPFVPEGTLVQILPPPVVPPKNPPQPMRSNPQTTRSSQLVITSEPVDTPVDQIEPVTSSSDDTGAGGAVDGFVDGTSLAPIVEPVIVPPPTVPVDIAEVMPSYDGGTQAMMKFIQKKIRVPSSFRYLGEGGTVYVRFVVRPGGKVTDVEVIRGLSKDCDKEAARVISIMPGWIAGMQNGTSVPVRMVLPIKFTQSEESAWTKTGSSKFQKPNSKGRAFHWPLIFGLWFLDFWLCDLFLEVVNRQRYKPFSFFDEWKMPTLLKDHQRSEW